MKIKKFDCVEIKHKAAERIHNKLRNRSIGERLSFWNEHYRQMRQKCRIAQDK